MGLIAKQYTFSTGSTIIAAEHNTNFDTIYDEINGQLDSANVDQTSLACLAETQTFSGNKTFSGTNTMSGTMTNSGTLNITGTIQRAGTAITLINPDEYVCYEGSMVAYENNMVYYK